MHVDEPQYPPLGKAQFWLVVWQQLPSRRYLLAGLILAVMALVQMHYQPRANSASHCVANFSVIDLEFAGNRGRANAILNCWSDGTDHETTIEKLNAGLWWDFGFALSYGWFGCLMIGCAARRAQSLWPALTKRLSDLQADAQSKGNGFFARWARFVSGFWRTLYQRAVRYQPARNSAASPWLIALPVAAAGLDCVENIALLVFLADPVLASNVWLLIASFSACLKFGLLTVALVLWLIVAVWVHLAVFWQTVLLASHLLVLIRVPLLIALCGVVLTYQVPQVAELFDLAALEFWRGVTALLAAGALGLLTWYSARTLYAFNWIDRIDRSANWRAFGEQGPRWLGAAVPATMAFGYLPNDWKALNGYWASNHWLWLFAYLALAASILAFTTMRRDIHALVHKSLQAQSAKTAKLLQIEDSAQVGVFDAWGQLDWRARAFHWLGLLVFLPAILIGSFIRDWIEPLGLNGIEPLTLILGAAAWLVWASTIPLYWAARARVPLLVLLFGVAAINSGAYNDNHAVRLDARMRSTDEPPLNLHYDAHGRPSIAEYIAEWHTMHSDCSVVYLISSEGGGIRAAAWTTLVLSKLDQRNPKMWPCTIAASGVSGGSVGLLAFAATKRDRLATERLDAMMTTDFLAPVLGVMFGTDQLQRFLPARLFTDRGQALEDRWRQSYEASYPSDAPNLSKGSFSASLATLLRDADGRLLPALLLNTTVVQTGRRMVLHPFAPESDCGERNSAAPEFSERCFPGADDGAAWFPAELPASSAALNSARFAYVSPAGSVYRRQGANASGVPEFLGQVVDGGYFENSGTVTLADFRDAIRVLAPPELAKKLRVIHLSNDADAPGILSTSEDACLSPMPELESEPNEPGPIQRIGGLSAPAITLYLTRDARAVQARQQLYQSMPKQFFHFRPCAGRVPLPLGWTLSKETFALMKNQLEPETKIRQAAMPLMLKMAVAD